MHTHTVIIDWCVDTYNNTLKFRVSDFQKADVISNAHYLLYFFNVIKIVRRLYSGQKDKISPLGTQLLKNQILLLKKIN